MTISFETFADELTYDALPGAVLAILRRSFIDTMGVAAVGSTTPLSKIVRRVAPMLFGRGTVGASRMLMDGTKVSPAGAAMTGAFTVALPSRLKRPILFY